MQTGTATSASPSTAPQSSTTTIAAVPTAEVPGPALAAPATMIDVSAPAADRITAHVALSVGDTLAVEVIGLDPGDQMWSGLCADPVAPGDDVVELDTSCGPLGSFGVEDPDEDGTIRFSIELPEQVSLIDGNLNCITTPCSWVALFAPGTRADQGQVAQVVVPLDLRP